jgi:glycosyltransferase involved in cell wall biosynthesis
MSRPLERSAPAASEAVICFGYGAATRRRQPWHAARSLALSLALSGASTRLLTDGAVETPDELFPVLPLGALRDGQRPGRRLLATLHEHQVGRAWLVIGAHELLRPRRLRLGTPTVLVIASPRLRLRELLRLGSRGLWRERTLLALAVVNALLPGWLLRLGFRRSGAVQALYLSRAAQARWARLGLPAGRRMPPRVAAAWRTHEVAPDVPVVGYFGPPLRLRGADLALRAFEDACERGLRARLELLLRPDGSDRAMADFLARVRRSPWRERIVVDTTMLAEEALRARVARWSCFLLPFRATVSDAPLVVIEAGLTGRPVLVLDAPGVTEYAQALGGLIARSPAQLREALLYAATAPRRPPPDPSAWTGPSPPPSFAGGPDPALFCVCGVDGVGKTRIADALAASLEAEGRLTRRFWSRFRNYLSRPLLALARLTGHNRKERVGGTVVGYHDFAGHRWLAWPFLVLHAADLALDVLLRCRWGRRGATLIADRCLLDGIVDLAVDTGRDRLVIDRLAPWLVRLLPRPWRAVIVERDPILVGRDRPDALADRHHQRRRLLYRRLAARLGLPVVSNDGPLDETVARVRAALESESA